jgi:glucose-6-phosphate isomerase
MQWSRDLHSIGQGLQDGPKTYWQTFLQAKSAGQFSALNEMHPIHDESQSYDIKHIKASLGSAVRKAHLDSGSKQLHLWVDEWSPKSVICKLQGINPFDQPGVEAYKQWFVKSLQEE